MTCNGRVIFLIIYFFICIFFKNRNERGIILYIHYIYIYTYIYTYVQLLSRHDRLNKLE